MSDKFLFIAIPRTGSMSVIEALKPHGLHAVKYDVGKVDTVFDPERPLTTFYHASIEALIEANVVTQEWVSRRTLITIVRNPWERMVSLYFYLFLTLSRHGSMKFDEFVVAATSAKQQPIGPYNWCGLSQASRQIDWLHQPCLHNNGYGLAFENLDAEWRAIRDDVIGYRNDVELPVTGQTKHDDYRAYYTPTTRRLVELYYEPDIARGGYTFD